MERLDKFLCDSGVGTRSQVKGILKSGRVTVDGVTERDPSRKIDPDKQTVCLDGEILGGKRRLVVMLNKPAGYVTATEDRQERTVMELLPEDIRNMDVKPVGRLDKASEGLLLLTNDGDFCRRVIEPSYYIPKTYYIRVGRPFQNDVEAWFQKGIVFPNGTLCRPAEIELSPDRREALVTVTEGKTHQVRRMASACGVRVQYLKRLSIGGLKLDETLLPGQCRPLKE